MKLEDVVDLEAQLALDEGRDEADLQSRDRALYLALPPIDRTVDALLRAWLEALRERTGAPRLGERVATAQRVLGYGLTLSGLVTGWGVAETLLHFEQDGAPVNVGHYLLVLVFGQLALLLLFGLGLVLRKLFPRLSLLGDAARVLRFVANRLQRSLRDAHPEVAQSGEAQYAAYQRVRTRIGLYEPLERCLLLRQTQLYALAFNVGALASCLRLILFSDLAFAWSTSLASLDAVQVHRLCQVLAQPFGWLVPDAVPSLTLIEHTQYFRLEGRFAGAAAGTRGNALLASEWWRFLIACTVTYGLLPRSIAFVWLSRALRRREHDVPLDTPAVQQVVARMTTPALTTRARDELAGAPESAPAFASLPGTGGPTALLLYRDIPTERSLLERTIAQALSIEITSVHEVGGAALQDEAALGKRLAETASAVALVAEAWEAPDKSLRKLLASLRSALGPRRTLRVLLIGEASARGYRLADADDVRVYRDRLALLRDPYLSIEPLSATVQASEASSS